MRSKPPTILSLQNANQLDSKHKFWDTSLAGQQRHPKIMSLVTADGSSNQQLSNHGIRILNNQKKSNNSDSDDSDANSDSSQVDQNQSELTINQVDRIKELQQQVQQLRAEIQEGRKLNTNILKQLNKTTNELRIAEKLNQQLTTQCDKFYISTKNAYDRQSEIQNQKMQLLIQISKLNQERQIAVNKSQIIQEQMWYLHKKILTINQQNSFEKSISADLRKQIHLLKDQLSKSLVHLKKYYQLQEEVAKTHQINNQIKKRFKRLQQELNQTRTKVQESQKSQQIHSEQQNRLFLKIKELENQNMVLSKKLERVSSDLKKNVERHENNQSIQSQYQERYVKILSQLQRRNQDLIFEVMAANERNHKLIDQRDYYMRRVQAYVSNKKQRLPYDQFVSILKATDNEVQNLKKRFQLKQDQYQRLRRQYENQSFNTQARIKQLSSILQIKQRQLTSREHLISNEKNIYKRQYDLMSKRNEQLKNNQVKLRLEIIEKDKIIMEFIQKQKIVQEQSRIQKIGAAGL